MFMEHNITGACKIMFDLLMYELNRAVKAPYPRKIKKKAARNTKSNSDGCVPVKRATKRCGVCRIAGCKGLGARIHCPVMKSRINAGLVACPPKKIRQCQVCLEFGPYGLNCRTGSGNRKLCMYYDLMGRCKL